MILKPIHLKQTHPIEEKIFPVRCLRCLLRKLDQYEASSSKIRRGKIIATYSWNISVYKVSSKSCVALHILLNLLLT